MSIPCQTNAECGDWMVCPPTPKPGETDKFCGCSSEQGLVGPVCQVWTPVTYAAIFAWFAIWVGYGYFTAFSFKKVQLVLSDSMNAKKTTTIFVAVHAVNAFFIATLALLRIGNVVTESQFTFWGKGFFNTFMAGSGTCASLNICLTWLELSQKKNDFSKGKDNVSKYRPVMICATAFFAIFTLFSALNGMFILFLVICTVVFIYLTSAYLCIANKLVTYIRSRGISDTSQPVLERIVKNSRRAALGFCGFIIGLIIFIIGGAGNHFLQPLGSFIMYFGLIRAKSAHLLFLFFDKKKADFDDGEETEISGASKVVDVVSEDTTGSSNTENS